MVEFGNTPNTPTQLPLSAYAVPTNTKFKRIGLASFLCGISACFSVALIGVILLFLGVQIAGLFGSVGLGQQHSGCFAGGRPAVDLIRVYCFHGSFQGCLAAAVSHRRWYGIAAAGGADAIKNDKALTDAVNGLILEPLTGY